MEIFEMQEEFDALMKKGQELIKKLKEKQVVDDSKKVERWKPKDEDVFWIISSRGKVEWYDWSNSEWDNGCYNFHNCFRTEEEAQKELDRRLAEQELSSYCDFDGRVELCYDKHAECFEADDCSELPYHHSPYRFSSKESCEKAIKQLGTEKLKLIFRID